jgi:hypothetical protein
MYLPDESRDISVGISLGYKLDDRGSRVRYPAGAANFSLHHRVQNGSGAHCKRVYTLNIRNPLNINVPTLFQLIVIALANEEDDITLSIL